MMHKNINSKQEINLCDYFKDDPGYFRYLNNNKNDKKESNISYNNSL